MTEAEMRAYIKRTLGFGVVHLELIDEMLNDAVVAAKIWYAGILGQLNSTALALSSNINEYSVPADCDYVTEVVTDGDEVWAQLGWPNSTVNLSVLGGSQGYNRSILSDLTQSMQYLEQLRRTTSMDIDWFYDKARRVLVITPNGKGSTRARIWYLTNNIDVTRLELYEAGLVQEYALACAMLTLSHIRTKYAELPGAAGGFTMNGDLLNADAIEMKRTLTEQLKGLQPPVPLLVG